MIRRYFSAAMLAAVFPWLLAFTFANSSSRRYRQWLITIFFTIFGSVATLTFGDGFDHQKALENQYLTMSFGAFAQELWQILTFQHTTSGAKDVYKHVVSYIFGSVLGMPRLFFPFVATVYGYFFAGSVLCVLRNFKMAHANYVILAFVVIFLFVRGIEGFSTVRTWTGMWILVYSCLNYYETKQRRYLILMFVPPFVHIGFFILALPAWLVLAYGSRPMLYTVILIVSSVTTILPVDSTSRWLSTTERGASQVDSYLVQEQRDALLEFERVQEQSNWYHAYQRAGFQRWAPTVLVFSLLLSGIYLRCMTLYQKQIFSIGVLTLALSNATWFLYAVHNRSLIISMVFILAGFLIARLDPSTRHYFTNLPPYYRWGLHLSIILFTPMIIFNVSMTLDWMSVFILGFPFLVWMDPEMNMSMKQFLRQLIN